MTEVESDEDIPQLSKETLLALNEFYNEQKEKEQKLTHLKENKDNLNYNFDENWVTFLFFKK